MEESPEICSLKVMAGRLQVTKAWLKLEAEVGDVPALKDGLRYLFNPEAVVEVLARRAAGKSLSTMTWISTKGSIDPPMGKIVLMLLASQDPGLSDWRGMRTGIWEGYWLNDSGTPLVGGEHCTHWCDCLPDLPEGNELNQFDYE